MSTEWIRPDGCEGGACVEYRTVDGKVFVRNPATPDVLVEFTVAEWDTFVAGLVAPIAAERDAARQEAYELQDTPADLERMAELEAAEAERDQLREELLNGIARAESLAAELNDAGKRITALLGERDRAAAGLEHLTDVLNQRDAAIAEAAVLRHRDRCTQAVVEAAKAWRKDLRQFVAAHHDGVDPFEYQGPAQLLIAAVDGLESDPLAAPSATEPVQQPQPVAQPTDGPEPQGQAQPGSGIVWHHSCGRTATTSPGVQPALECDCPDTYGPWTSYSTTTAPLVVTEDTMLKVRWPGSAGTKTYDLTDDGGQVTPRVWNAGDPEPKGVEKVTDEDGDTWVRDDPMWVWTDDWGVSNAQDWAPLLKAYGPLTEVLPEPAPATGGIIPAGTTFAVEPDPVEQWVPLATTQFRCRDEYVGLGLDPSARIVRCNLPLGHDGDHDEMIDGEPGNSWPRRKPDGEVPEAGRAGEAQTILAPVLFPKGWTVDEANAGEYYRREAVEAVLGRRSYFADSSPDAHKNSSDVRPQGRTEVGLDAAIEAAVAAARFEVGDRIWPAGVKLRASDVNAAIEERIRIGLHAASPLIERAALNAAADRMEGRGYTSSSAVAWLRLLAEGKTV